MFGFGNTPDHFGALLEYLVEDWGMRARFASAFLTAYRIPISKLHERGLRNLGRVAANGSADQRLIAMASEPRDYAIVGQAYQAYLKDLRRGRHVGTDVELSIWAILVSHSDLLTAIDAGLADFMQSKHSERFPQLFDTVFSDASPIDDDLDLDAPPPRNDEAEHIYIDEELAYKDYTFVGDTYSGQINAALFTTIALHLHSMGWGGPPWLFDAAFDPNGTKVNHLSGQYLFNRREARELADALNNMTMSNPNNADILNLVAPLIAVACAGGFTLNT